MSRPMSDRVAALSAAWAITLAATLGAGGRLRLAPGCNPQVRQDGLTPLRRALGALACRPWQIVVGLPGLGERPFHARRIGHPAHRPVPSALTGRLIMAARAANWPADPADPAGIARISAAIAAAITVQDRA